MRCEVNVWIEFSIEVYFASSAVLLASAFVDAVSVFITAPSDGATVSGTAWFTIWIENAAAGSKTYTLSVGGSAVATTTTTSNGPVSIPWSTTGTANGSTRATVTVRDSAGSTASAARTVNVAN